MAHRDNLNTQNQTCGRTGCWKPFGTSIWSTKKITKITLIKFRNCFAVKKSKSENGSNWHSILKNRLCTVCNVKKPQEWIKIQKFPRPERSKSNSNDIKVRIGHWTKNWSRGEVKQIYYEAEEITKSFKIQIIWLEHIYHRLKSRRFKYLIWLIWVIKYQW